MIFIVLFIIPLIDFIFLFRWAELFNWYLVFGYILLGFWIGSNCIKRANIFGSGQIRFHQGKDALPQLVAYVVAGFLFFAPGPLTDILAVLVLIPATRKLLFTLLIKNLSGKLKVGGFAFQSRQGSRFEENFDDVIDVDAREVKEISGVLSNSKKNHD